MNKASRDFLYSLIDYEKVVGYDYNLDAYKKFLTTFASPHQQLKNVILIGGTKGKGSTAAILSSALQGSGYRVGLYTSPHLKEVNERIKINGRNISDLDFDRHLSRIMPTMKKSKGARSFFEALTTVAFLHFLEKGVDITVLEVGLGGRLDATNATQPLLSVITRIGYDHTNLLGTRLEQIAREKAGIMREGGTLITIRQRPTVSRVLSSAARAKKSRIVFANEQHKLEILMQSIKGSNIRVTGRLGCFELFLPLVGSHQIENTSLALAILNELQGLGIPLSVDGLAVGIEKTRLHGRFEVVGERPLIIFDCAHNDDSFRALDRNLTAFNIRNFYLVFGTNRDKDYKYCMKTIFPKAREVFLVKADQPRALEPVEILARGRRHQKNITTGASVREILELLAKRQKEILPIIVTGSFYLWQEGWNRQGVH